MRFEEVQETIKQLEKDVDLASAVTRLHSNPDFIRVFEEHYFNTYLKHLANEMVKSNKSSLSANDCLEKIRASSITEAYLNHLIDQGQSSQDNLRVAKSIPDSEFE